MTVDDASSSAAGAAAAAALTGVTTGDSTISIYEREITYANMISTDHT